MGLIQKYLLGVNNEKLNSKKFGRFNFYKKKNIYAYRKNFFKERKESLKKRV